MEVARSESKAGSGAVRGGPSESVQASGPLREGALAAAVFAAALLLLFWDAFFLGRALLPADLIYFLDPLWQGAAPAGIGSASNPLLADQVYQGYAWRAYVAQWLARGVLPLWNASILGGVSLVGNDQSALFYPFNLLALLLPVASGFAWTALARLMVAGLSTYGYLRVTGRGVGAAYLGAFAFTLGGFLIVWLGYPVDNVAVWLPTILLLVELVYRRRSPGWAGLLALAFGVQYLGGHAETSFHVGLAAGAYALFLAGQAWRSGARAVARRGLLHSALGALLGLGVGAVQILPFLEQLGRSSVAADRSAANASSPWLNPAFWKEAATLPTLLVPGALGTPTEPEYFAFTTNYVEAAAYVGTIPLLLAFLGARRALGDSRLGFWLIAGLVSLAIAYRLPGFEVVNHLPLFDVTVNGRLRLVFSFAAAVLGAAGLDSVLSRLDRPVPERRRALGRVIRLAAVVAGATLIGLLGVYLALSALGEPILAFGRRYVETSLYGQPGLPYPLDYYLAKVDRYYEVAVGRFAPASWRTYLPVGTALALALVLWLAARGRLGRRAAASALVVATAAELLAVGAGFNPTLEASAVFPTTPAVEYLREHAGADRVVGLGFALMPNSAMVWSLQDVRGYEAVRPARTWGLLRDVPGRVPFGEYLILERVDSPVLDLFGARYVVAGEPLAEPERFDLRLVYSRPGALVYRNEAALPRAYVAFRASVLATGTEVLARLRAPELDLREEVLLEAEQHPPIGDRPVGAAASARIVRHEPNRVLVEATLEAAGYLVLTDSYDEGWAALVDGRSAPVYRANYAFRAVYLEAGRHTVEFVYRPLGVAVGAGVSGLSLVVALLLVLPMAAGVARSRHPDQAGTAGSA